MRTVHHYIVPLLLALWMIGCRPSSRATSTPTPGPTVYPEAQADTTPVPATPLTAADSTPEIGDNCVYAAEFVEDVTVPDYASVKPGETFTKVWRLQNTGTCDWANLTLVFISDDRLGGESPTAVPPTSRGEFVDISLELMAPSQPGQYLSVWQLHTADGRSFGPPVYTRIIVQATGLSSTSQSPYAVSMDDGCVLDAAFIADVTIPDGTTVEANESFNKIWRMQNLGTCDWGEGYNLVFVSGDQMRGPGSVPISPTRVGETTDIVVPLTSPGVAGNYTGWWRLQAPDGTLFGIWPYVRIEVASSIADRGMPDPPTHSIYAGYIHNLTAHSREIFLEGQAQGNRANVFSKVGDSITDVWAFLNPIGDGVYDLHDYDYLQPVINYFSTTIARSGNSFNNVSLSAVSGWNSFDVLNPDKVADTCPRLTPLECEYTLAKPSAAIIMIGTNDATAAVDLAAYEANVRRMVEISIENGVVPVLSTIPYDQWGDEQAYNQVIISTAVSYDVPWMDFHAVTWDLPNHGIEPADGVHPSVPPTNDPTNFSEENLQYGHTVRNLLVLHVLDALWRQVMY